MAEKRALGDLARALAGRSGIFECHVRVNAADQDDSMDDAYEMRTRR